MGEVQVASPGSRVGACGPQRHVSFASRGTDAGARALVEPAGLFSITQRLSMRLPPPALLRPEVLFRHPQSEFNATVMPSPFPQDRANHTAGVRHISDNLPRSFLSSVLEISALR